MNGPNPSQAAVQVPAHSGAPRAAARRLDAADLAELAPAKPTAGGESAGRPPAPSETNDGRPSRPGSLVDIRV